MRRNCLFVLAVMTCCLAFASLGLAGMWRPMGPYSGMIFDLVMAPEDPNVLFLGVNGGFFKSLNGADSWERVGEGYSFYPDSISAARAGRDLVIASTMWNVYLSLDGGVTWRKVEDLPFSYGTGINSVAIDPRNPEAVWVCTSKGLCWSGSSGNNWYWRNDGLPENFDPRSVRFDLSDASGGRLYVFSLSGGIYRSDNFGDSWELAVPEELKFTKIDDLALDRQDGETLYACSKGLGVIKSVDGGSSWAAKNAGLSQLRVNRIAIFDSEPNVFLYCATNEGVYISEDGAETWQRREEGVVLGTHASSLIVSPVAADVGYIGTQFGVYKTVDRGFKWRGASFGCNAVTVTNMAFDLSRPGTIFTATEQGFFGSSDNGLSWHLLSVEGMAVKYPDVMIVALDPQESSTVYAGTGKGKLIKSGDRGETWEELYSAPFGICQLLIDPTDPQTMYMTIASGEVLKSEDAGATWAEAMRGVVGAPGMQAGALAMNPRMPSILWLAITDSSGGMVYRSQDEAGSWQPVVDFRASDIAISPVEPETVYLGGHGGLLVARADDIGGYTLEELNSGLLCTWVNRVSITPGNPDVLFVATGSLGMTSIFAGVYKSPDGGRDWTRLSCENMVGTVCNYVAADPFSPNEVWTGFLGNGLLKYTDEPGPPIELSLSTGQNQYVAGDTHIARISATNNAGDIDVDLYIAIMLPDGSLLFWPEFSSEMSAGYSMTPMPRGFSMTDVVFFQMALPYGLPGGMYTWFAMCFAQGAEDAVSNLASADWTFQ
ncbi:MAG TPA: hypothetical protein VM163_02780 [bacterium]|nr:hypothetical protein [bacterium]